jgi:transcription elongation factor GreA
VRPLEQHWLSFGRSGASAGVRQAMTCERTEPAYERIVTAGDRIQNWNGILPGVMKARFLKKFEDELQALERELKMELPKEIKRARELGDLRENAEYQAAKERQRLVEARIGMLQKRISEISMMNLERIPHGKVGFGSTVHLRDSDGQPITYQLVMPEDADAAKGWISTASPIGRALLNKEEGDEVKVVTPSGARTFEITKLSTIHDDAE